MAFDYFRGEQSEQFTFYRTPKVLYTAPVFRKLSPLSKQLYGILLDRVSLSIRNGWMDEAGRVYVYYTTKQVMEALSCSDKTATKMLKELEAIGLVERKRQGLGKPNRVYVKNFLAAPGGGVPEELRFQNRKNYDSGIEDSTSQESENLRSSNTDRNKTERSDTDLILSGDKRGSDERAQYREILRENLSADLMMARYPHDRELIREILENMLDVLCSSRKTIQIAGERRSAEVVKLRFLSLDSSHLVYVLECLRNGSSDIRNIKQYLLAVLYNAPLTIDSYYRAQVGHDMAEGEPPDL